MFAELERAMTSPINSTFHYEFGDNSEVLMDERVTAEYIGSLPKDHMLILDKPRLFDQENDLSKVPMIPYD